MAGSVCRCMTGLICLLVLLTVAGIARAGEAELPFADADFYPSSLRPVGWRGDGTGCFPGATVPDRWDAKTGENIVWKTKVPAGFSQPIVVGEKVFITADPAWLICLSIHDGRVLWKRHVDHTEAMPEDMRDNARKEIEFWRDKWAEYSRWRLAVIELEKKVKAAGHSTRGMYRDIKQHKILEKPDHESMVKEHEKILADEDLGKEYRRLKTWQDDNGFAVLTACNGEVVRVRNKSDKMRGKPQPPLKARWLKAQKTYDIWFADNWEGYTTWSFATPCSDGQNVYVTTVNNAVACYDLKGNKKWLVWDHPADNSDTGPLHTRFVASPFLQGDSLVVYQNCELRAYDKATGKKRWGLVNPYRKKGRNHDRRSCRQTPEAASPRPASLPMGAHTLEVVIDGGGQIYRLSDGKVVGKGLQYMAKGATPIVSGDLYIWLTSGDNRPGRFGVQQMEAVSPNEVKVRKLWDRTASRHKGSASPVSDGSYVYLDPSREGALAMELRTGETKKITSGQVGVKSSSPIIAGDKLIAFRCGSFWDRKGQPDGYVDAMVVHLETGRRSELRNCLRDLRVLEDKAFMLRNRFVGCGNMVSNASPYAQANRLLMRTKGYVWCIGEKDKPFPTPGGCPEEARSPRLGE